MLKQNLAKNSWMLAAAALLAIGVLNTACEKESKEELAQVNENTGGGGTECDTSSVSYATDIQPIFNRSCAFSGCHVGNSAQFSNGHDLSSYERTQQTTGSAVLLGSIKHESGFSRMPKGGGKLPACEIALIEAWINAGRPNN